MTASGLAPARRALVGAALVALALVGAYIALGGATYRPLEVADPCEQRPLEALEERDEVLEALALSALDGAACRLRVTREELTLAIADPEERARLAEAIGVSEADIEAAVEAGLLRAVDDAERIGSLSSLEATLLREGIQLAPIGVLIDVLETASGGDPLELLGELAERLR